MTQTAFTELAGIPLVRCPRAGRSRTTAGLRGRLGFRTGWLGTLLAVVCVACAPSARLVVLQRRIWSVGARGRIEPFPFCYPSWYYDGIEGSTVPLPSPNCLWIAFGREHDVYLLGVKSRHERRITWLGRPGTRHFVEVYTLLAGWSPDSRRLLLNLVPGEDVSESLDLAVPKAPYGFYVYDTVRGGISPVALPKNFEFKAWLPDGRILGVVLPQVPGDVGRLVTFRPGDSRVVPVRVPVRIGRVQVTADGKWITGLVTGKAQSLGTAQLVKINLKTMSVVPLVSLTSWTGNEFPALSPSGGHFAYVRETQMVYRPAQDDLVVDGRTLYSCPEGIDYGWISGRTIALSCQKSVYVFNALTGRQLSRYSE